MIPFLTHHRHRVSASVMSVLTGIGLLFLGLPIAAPAQVSVTTQTQEYADIPLGSIFEVLTVLPGTEVPVTWMLTKGDGTFVQADRGRIFRERFAEQGLFTLRAEMSGTQDTSLTVHTFFIRVVPAPAVPAPAIPSGAIVRTEPAATGNNVVLGTDRQSVRLTPVTPGTGQMTLDLDAETDSNGDGNKTNDPDNDGTFFLTNGTPLTLWFPVSPVNRTVTVATAGAQGITVQTLRITTHALPVVPKDDSTALPNVLNLPLIGVEDRGTGAFAFTLKQEALSASGRVLLFLWDFGDGKQSMLDRPVHTYAENATFAVKLRVRDLITTQEVLTTSGTLEVRSVPVPGESSSSAATSASSETSASSVSSPASASSQSSAGTGSAGDTSTVTMILIAIGVVGGSLLLGLLVMFVLSKIVKSKLDDAPKASVKTGPKSKRPGSKTSAPSLDAVSPMSVIDVSMESASPDMEISTPEEPPLSFTETPEQTAEPSPPVDSLHIEVEQAPAWLRQGVEKAKSVGQEPLNPPPPALRQEPVVPPSDPSPEPFSPAPVASAPASPSAQATATDEANMPAWLSNAQQPPPPAQEPVPEQEETPPTPPEIMQETPPTVPQEQSPTKPPPKTLEPVPDITESVQTPAPPSASPTEPPAEELSPEERERRRKKRQRYRANKKRREQEGESQTASPASDDQEAVTEETEIEESTAQPSAPVSTVTPVASAPSAPATPDFATHSADGPATPPPSPLKIEESEAPEWLRKGVKKAQEKGQTPASPPPAPLAAPSPEAPDETIAIIRADNITEDDKKSS